MIFFNFLRLVGMTFLVQLVSSEQFSPILVWHANTAESEKADTAIISPMVDILVEVDNLKLEDFVACKQELKQIGNSFDNAISRQFSVASPSMFLKNIGLSFELSGFDQLLNLEAGKKKSFKFASKPAARSSHCEYLSHVNDIVQNVTSRLEDQAYRVIILASIPESSQAVNHIIRKRAAGDTTNYFNLNCIKLYFSAPPYLLLGNSTKLLLPHASVNTSSSCNDNASSQTATLTWSNVNTGNYQLTSVTVKFQFQLKSSTWTTQTSVKLLGTDNGQAINKDFSLATDEVFASKSFSYHCGDRRWEVSSSGSNSSGILLAAFLPGFQVQPFASGVKFGRAMDCVSFFTVPILSGLLLSLILLGVVMWAMQMLASVPTADKWDDARGKPLQVAVSE